MKRQFEIIQSFITTLAPAVVFSILLGAIGEAIIARLVNELVLKVINTLATHPLMMLIIYPYYNADAYEKFIHILGMISVAIMAYRVVPVPRGLPLSRSIYVFLTVSTYLAYWLIGFLNVASKALASTYISTLNTIRVYVVPGIDVWFKTILSIIATYISAGIVTVFKPGIGMTLFITVMFCIIVLTHLCIGLVQGLNYRLVEYVSRVLTKHPAWGMFAVFSITFILSYVIAMLTVILVFTVLSTIIGIHALSVVAGVSPTAWVSAFLGFTASIISATLLGWFFFYYILGEVRRLCRKLSPAPPPTALILVLVFSLFIAWLVLREIVAFAVVCTWFTLAVTVNTVYASGMPKRVRTISALITTLLTVLCIYHALSILAMYEGMYGGIIQKISELIPQVPS